MDFQLFRVGKIVNTHGLSGEVKVYLHTDFPEDRFKKGNQLFIGEKAISADISVEIQYSKPYKNMYVLKFKDFNTINDVLNLKDKFLWIPKEQLKELDKNEYYYYQIIGCNVVATDGKEIGVVKEIFSSGANDVWVIKAKGNNREILIPYIETIVKEVDIENKKIVIEVMEGLLD